MKLKNVFLTLLSLVLTLLAVEGVLRLADYPPAPPIGWRWDESPYRAPFNADDHGTNQLGLRGNRVEYGADDFVVLLLGDSQVESGTQTADKLPEVVLRQELERAGMRKIKVFSVAGAGWGQDQQLVWLKEYFRHYRADLVLNWLTPVNDYWENTFVDRSVTPEAGRLKPTYTLAGGKHLQTVMPAAFDSRLVNLVALADGRIKHGAKFTLEQGELDRWSSQLPSPHSLHANAADCPAAELDQKLLIGAYMSGSRGYTLVTDENLGAGRSHFSPFLKNMSERDRYAVAITHRLLQEIANVARSHRASFFMFHPYRHDLDAAFREIRCIKTADGERYAYDGSDWLRHLKATPLKNQLITFDIHADKALSSGPNDWHFNEEGNRRVMKELADILMQRKLTSQSAG
ncbi:hypothetical protein [Noviherbaspirillum saxi]|uniref:SGNH/GDSL hydrolase family protein n=1 Tax=Noviherbaspirillum saxi TaxID=2320863 RepID=A0A3A3GEN3_9BURK|nr:hypothetical protein [Noviherbaspirillum saxi]RJF99369.1 hypothetical protein D3871_13185 [Noviherbaspirillum saxi]